MRTPALFFILFCATGAAADTELWETVGDWEVRIDKGSKIACFATRTLNDGSSVYIGFDPNADGGYFAIYNLAWTHIKIGQPALVEFDFGAEKFAGESLGRFRDGMPGGHARFNNPAFAQAFANYNTVQITGSRGVTYSLSLTGTRKAVAATETCQDAQPQPEASE